MTPRRTLLVVLIIIATVAMAVPATAQTETTTACDQSVTHSFRTASAETTWNETADVASTESNTQVSVADGTGFVRVAGENPNGYCTTLTVELPADIVTPSDLGTVDSLNETVEADWRAVQNFSTGAEFTRITFTLAAGQSAAFAPNKARVVTLAWVTETKRQSNSIVDRISGLFRGDDALDQRTYTIEGQPGNRKTVPLTSANTSATVTDWIAEYRTADGSWQPVGQDPEAAVYYTEPSEDALRLHYNEDTTVRWTANPTFAEKISYQWSGYSAGWDGLGDLADSLPF
ncbi:MULTISPECIES: hypothetical protein [Salinibaculum]|uniref:hypothetical protein n=1 Tax=Salinibaculum TaxID=2732368 RepID=UPI0030D5E676